MKISFTGFFRSQQNLIDWTPTPYAQMPRKTNLLNTGNYALATNLWQVSTKGLELDFQYVKKMGKNQQLSLLSGLVWMESLSNEQTPSFYLSSHARFLWNAQLIWRMGAFEMAVTSVYKERNTQQATAIKAAVTPSYFLLNSRISFFTYQQKLSLQLDCTNITNTQYSDLLGAAMPGRWASAGLCFKM